MFVISWKSLTMHSPNPNFRLWTSYMKMVELLLAMIRAYRDGNWDLHLESFAAMLHWLTIYDHTNYARWGPVYPAGIENLETKAPKVHAAFIAGNFVVKRTNKRFNQVPADQATEWMRNLQGAEWHHWQHKKRSSQRLRHLARTVSYLARHQMSVQP